MSLLPAVFSLLIAPAAARSSEEGEAPVLDVQVGESYIKREPRALARVLISNPEVAELRLLEEGQFQVRGVAVGSTDLWIWYRDDVEHPRQYTVVVANDLTELRRRLVSAVGEDGPRIYAVKDRIVVEGEVADVETLERAAAIARIYDEDFVNLMSVKGDHQVQLHVTFAEVSRSSVRELGLNAMALSPTWLTQMFGPNRVESLFVDLDDQNTEANRVYPASSAAYNLGGGIVLPGGISIGAYLSVLEQNALARTLARPTLVALSGQQAEFLAGGEVPIPVAQNNGRISIEFKEYGTKLVFVPTVLGNDVIDMQVYVEVSSIDSSSATRLSGIEIPSFVSRKGDSHLRLNDGMTFAMAGMLKETSAATRSQVPLLGDIPLLGALFRYVKHTREETELVIFVTPELVRPMAAKDVPAPPGTTENYNPDDLSLFLLGSLVQPGTRSAEPTGEIGMVR